MAKKFGGEAVVNFFFLHSAEFIAMAMASIKTFLKCRCVYILVIVHKSTGLSG